MIGYGAVKYFDLKVHRNTSYTFSYDRMLDLKGNTAVYLLYAYARIRSIIRKSGVNVDSLLQEQAQQEKQLLRLEHDAEWQLALRLVRFREVLEQVIEYLEPHLLCDYLYDLANTFTAFHRDCRVIDEGKVNESRLLLCHATATVMSQCFDLLGIDKLERI